MKRMCGFIVTLVLWDLRDFLSTLLHVSNCMYENDPVHMKYVSACQKCMVISGTPGCLITSHGLPTKQLCHLVTHSLIRTCNPMALNVEGQSLDSEKIKNSKGSEGGCWSTLRTVSKFHGYSPCGLDLLTLNLWVPLQNWEINEQLPTFRVEVPTWTALTMDCRNNKMSWTVAKNGSTLWALHEMVHTSEQ